MSVLTYIALCTLVLVIFIAIFLVYRHARTDQAIAGSTKAIEGVSDRLDSIDKATELEHGQMSEQLKKVANRTQFLVASRISDEVSAARAATDDPNNGEKQP